MVEIVIFQQFFIALMLGALIGLERERSTYKQKRMMYAGIRTFPLIALFGALSAYFAQILSAWILIVNILIMGVLVIIVYFVTTDMHGKHFGATSEIAGLLTFFIGVLAYYNEIVFATVLAITITFILYLREPLHTFAQHLKRGELEDTLKFIVIAFVILPFLPNQGFGPYDIFNPYVIWLMVVLISGISYVGYFFMKWFGEKGIELAGIFGGLVSSTAVTISFAARSKQIRSKKIIRPLLLGVVLANSIMFIRILVEVFLIHRPLFYALILPLSALFTLSLVFIFFLWKKDKHVKGKVDLKSPFRLWPALKFGAFFALVLAVVKIADVYLSTKGVYVVSLISGFADVDAITLSLSHLAKGDLALEIAKRGIMIAALTNVAVKGGIAYLFGSREFGVRIIGMFGALIGLGLVLVFII
jgi:uncharacterized membrane protein (DUF4010 family)